MSTFTCPACSRSFLWKPALAGRRLRCPCGSPLFCPPTAPDAPAAIITAPPTVLAYRTAAPATKEFDPESFKNLNLPIALLAGGVAIDFLANLLLLHHDLQSSLRHVAIGLGCQTILMLAALLIAARFRGIKLGHFWTAVLKLAAISVAPAAAVTLALPLFLLIPIVGGLAEWIAEFALSFALLGLLFDLDESDTWYCCGVIFVLNVLCYFFLPGIT